MQELIPPHKRTVELTFEIFNLRMLFYRLLIPLHFSATIRFTKTYRWSRVVLTVRCVFCDCLLDSSWQIAKVSILANYKQNTPHAMGRFICLMRLPLIFSLPVAQRRNRMNNTKKGDSGAKLIFGNEEWDEKPFFLISLIEHKSRV